MADQIVNSNLGAYDRDGNYSSPGGATSEEDFEALLKARPVNMPNMGAYLRDHATRMPAQNQPSTINRQPSAQTISPRITGGPTPQQSYSDEARASVEKGGADLDAGERLALTEPDTSKLDALDKEINWAKRPTQLRENQPMGDKNQAADMGVGTGKMLPQFEPSLGQKIWRGARSGIIGLMAGGLPGAAIGALEPGAVKGGKAYGAPNSKYEQAETDRQATLANLESQRPQMSEALKTAIESRKAQATELGTLAERRNQGATALNETPGAKAETKQLEDAVAYNERQQRWPTVANLVPPSQRAAMQVHYMLTGEMPKAGEPRQPSAEEIMLARGVELKTQELGHPLKYEDFMAVVRDVKAKGGADQDDTAQALWAKAGGELESFRSGFTQSPKSGRWMNTKSGQSYTNEEYLNEADKIRKKYNVELSKMGYTINPDGQMVSLRQGGQPGAAPAAAATQPARQGPPAGFTHKVKASDGKWHWGNPKTKEIGDLAE